MRLLLLTLVGLALAGCATTRILQVPASFVSHTNQLARQYLNAIAGHDRHQLTALGRTPEEVDADLRQARALANPPKPRFLFDSMVGDTYCRQYAVALSAGARFKFAAGSMATPTEPRASADFR